MWQEPVHQGLEHTSITSFKINNLCTIYSGRNTFAWASARTARSSSTPKGVDGQHEHEYNMLSTGRKAAKFSGQLEGTDPGYLGASSSAGLLHRLHRHPTPVTSAPRDACLYRDALESDRGDHRIAEQRGNRGSSAWPKQFHIPTILGRKEGWGIQTSGKLESIKPICRDRAFQDGRSPHPPFSNTTRGLDGETGSERCLPSGSNSPKPPPVPAIPMEREHISIQVPPIRPLSCTTGVHKTAEASDRSITPNWNQAGNLLGRYSNPPSVQTTARSPSDTDMPAIRGTRPHDKQEEVPPVTNLASRVLRLPSLLNHLEVLNSERETPEDTAGCSPPPATDYSVPKGASKVYRENNCHSKGTPSSPPTLQGYTETNELSVSINPMPVRGEREVQHTCSPLQRGEDRPDMVGRAGLGGKGSTNLSPITNSNTGIGCLQHGLGNH